ncbi:unnamed protein product [Allacma fusca]|uniref:Uncharacterized protein n=1 Tax=Allacma fusca TaxID=39272 RepID=A0A8J2PTD2_9HEXA|nr:unnamed protein product [Allacma fusca]
MNYNVRRISLATSSHVDKGTDFDHHEGVGPQGGAERFRRLSQLSKGGGYGVGGGFNPRYLSRGGTSRHPHSYSLQ